ncbi:hypothetical protein H0H81_003538 [Sphagnurus paluster]|uniref:Uncharacterized protein n=1 Tax=Sphagnurus paluster TaxID=117069 RepID=A0A9P7GTF7_9AGAR|nr:hypothetical protein H0H81_003538 [Sphagnurus paluster]
MSNGNGIFYAYAKDLKNDTIARYIITFATRNVADVWYRAILDSVSQGHERFASVRRVSLQLYTHEYSEKTNITDTLNDAQVAAHLRGQMFFTLLNDKPAEIGIFELGIFIVSNPLKHIHSFYIRSVPQPDTYWYYDMVEGGVFASRNRRTRFTVTIVDKKRSPGTFMVDNDEVYITLGSNISFGVDVNKENQLAEGRAGGFPFKFSCFKTDFQIELQLNGPAVKAGPTVAQDSSGLGAIVRNVDKGERWELV